MQLLASHPYLNLYLHEGNTRALEARWKGYVSSAVLRQALTDALALAGQHGVTAWIADERRLGAVRPDDLRWVGQHLMPQLVALGVTRVARIEATDPLNRLLIQREITASQQVLPFEVRVFGSSNEARVWACG